MKIKKFEFNMFPVNCYVVWDESNEAVIIDPGCYYDEEKQALKEYILSHNLTVKHHSVFYTVVIINKLVYSLNCSIGITLGKIS